MNFTQVKTFKDMDLKLESSGQLTLIPPGHVEWSVVKPQPMKVVLDKDAITMTADGNTETFKTGEAITTKDRKNFEDLLVWMKLDAETIAARYRVSRESSEIFHFDPIFPDAPLRRLTMALAKSGEVKRLTFFEKSGDKMEISFGAPKVSR